MAVTSKRERLFMLLRLIYEKTDEDHPMDTNEIIEHAEDEGLSLDRNTLNSDMNFLIEKLGYDIVKIRSAPNKYYWGERRFEMSELKLLLDAVVSSHFITNKKGRVLADKLMMFTSEYNRKDLQRYVYASEERKSKNNNLNYIIDRINDAIEKKKKLSFMYYEYNDENRKVLRNNGKKFVISPYEIYYQEGRYYVAGYSDHRNKVVSLLAGRIINPVTLDEDAVPEPKDFNVECYGNSMFSMLSGSERLVTLECEVDLMDQVTQMFGENVETEEKNPDVFTAKVLTEAGPAFYGWIFQFNGKIRIVEPDDMVITYIKQLKECLDSTY